eukprot:GFUD01045270.1.p1 GENE.GFUD01045270.1~~GFUD01045270.1.p1  ORF type:complete len:161 (+),score=39.56 GFUD01045270.1:1236-1718(+)
MPLHVRWLTASLNMVTVVMNELALFANLKQKWSKVFSVFYDRKQIISLYSDMQPMVLEVKHLKVCYTSCVTAYLIIKVMETWKVVALTKKDMAGVMLKILTNKTAMIKMVLSMAINQWEVADTLLIRLNATSYVVAEYMTQAGGRMVPVVMSKLLIVMTK